jgi:hypothetical protein
MLTAREYLDRSSDNKKTCELYNVIYEYLDSLTLDSADPRAKRMLLKLHELDCGPHFDVDIAIKAVTSMENVDGTTGQHWTFAEVEKEAQKRNIDQSLTRKSVARIARRISKKMYKSGKKLGYF